MVAFKNSLLGLDLHDPPPKTRAKDSTPRLSDSIGGGARPSDSIRLSDSVHVGGGRPSDRLSDSVGGGASVNKSKKRKIMADAVVKNLSSYYKNKKVSSKVEKISYHPGPS